MGLSSEVNELLSAMLWDIARGEHELGGCLSSCSAASVPNARPPHLPLPSSSVTLSSQGLGLEATLTLDSVYL